MDISYPIYIDKLISRLYDHGYEGFIVGGSIRNILLGLDVKDWDICTSALPGEVMDIFSEEYKVIPTGIAHGTVTVLVGNEHVEITTYRQEGEYVDGRRPEDVVFIRDLKEDLRRRDFTINALAYNHREGLIDFNHGLVDLDKQLIKTVGNPDERFSEDYLRMMRCVRFACQLGFTIDEDTYKALINNSSGLVNISKERIREELEKILISKAPCRGLRLLAKTKLLDNIIPEMVDCIGFEQNNPYHDKDVFEHTLDVIENTKNNRILRLAALFHDIGKPRCYTTDEDGIGHFYGHHLQSEDIARHVLTDLRYDKDTINKVCVLVKEHMVDHSQYRDKAIKRLINRVGKDNIDILFDLMVADKSGRQEDIVRIEEIRLRCNKILNAKEPLSIKDLEIDGKDIIKLGIQPGKKIGILLGALLDMVLENPKYNQRDVLINKCKTMILEINEKKEPL